MLDFTIHAGVLEFITLKPLVVPCFVYVLYSLGPYRVDPIMGSIFTIPLVGTCKEAWVMKLAS